jgi:hypothetical protein
MRAIATVETTTRWETLSLLRKLRGHDAYAIQVGPDHWLVRSPVGTSARTIARVEELVSEWAAEEGTALPAIQLEPRPVQAD